VADDVRQRLLRVKDVSKVELFGVQAEKLYIEVSQRRLATLGLDMNQVLASWGSRTRSSRPAPCRRRRTWCRCGWRGLQFGRATARHAHPGPNGTQIRLGDIAQVELGYVDPPQVLVRHNGQDSIALGISMAKGGDIIALGKALKTAVAEIEAELPAGMRWCRCRTSPPP
jgi:multidrug efflux pump